MKNTANTVRQTHYAERVKKSDSQQNLYIESYGVKIAIKTNRAEAVDAIRDILDVYLIDHFKEINACQTEHNFRFRWNASGVDSIYKNGKKVFPAAPRKTSLEYFGSEIRRTVAEFAADHVFIHAGVVSWKGRAIIIPARSFGGKTTLTAELVKRGALYYSDEYAVLDKEGFVHPFPKQLSVRGITGKYSQVELPVEDLGGKSAKEKTRVGMFLITEYKPKARWNPVVLSSASGIMEIINHTVPIRTNPRYVLETLSCAVRNAVIVKSPRPDVSMSVSLILDLFEKTVCSAENQ